MKSALCSVARLTVVPPIKTGVEFSHRRQLAGAAHLHGNVAVTCVTPDLAVNL